MMRQGYLRKYKLDYDRVFKYFGRKGDTYSKKEIMTALNTIIGDIELKIKNNPDFIKIEPPLEEELFNSPILFTSEIEKRIISYNGGISSVQLLLLTGKSQPDKGWLNSLRGKYFDPLVIKKCIELKDKHL